MRTRRTRAQDAQMRVISRQMNRITKLLPPDTKRRADQVARTFQSRVSSSRRGVDYYRTASRALGARFRRLTPQERDVLTAYIMFQAIKSLESDMKGKRDKMKEMGEMNSLRLQMTMDRRSKFISTLSQMMKKISSTQDILIQNIK